MTVRPDTAWSEASLDLRKVGAHPDHWYPVAWSREVKPGQTYAARFAGEPIALVRPRSGSGFRPGGSLRTPAGAVVERHGRWLHHPLLLSRLALRRVGRLRRCSLSRQSQAAERCPPLSLFRSATGLSSCGRATLSPADPPAGANRRSGRHGLQDAPIRQARSNCHYSFMHENLMDMNHQFLHRRTTGKVVPRFRESRAGAGWMEVDYSFARPDEKPPLGEAVIVGGLRGRALAARDLHDGSHRISIPELADVDARGQARAQRLARLYPR